MNITEADVKYFKALKRELKFEKLKQVVVLMLVSLNVIFYFLNVKVVIGLLILMFFSILEMVFSRASREMISSCENILSREPEYLKIKAEMN